MENLTLILVLLTCSKSFSDKKALELVYEAKNENIWSYNPPDEVDSGAFFNSLYTSVAVMRPINSDARNITIFNDPKKETKD